MHAASAWRRRRVRPCLAELVRLRSQASAGRSRRQQRVPFQMLVIVAPAINRDRGQSQSSAVETEGQSHT